jgi:phage terminase small subunit
VPKLIKMGVAKSADTDTLASMAEWWAVYRKQMDAVIDGDESKLTLAIKAWDKFLPLADRFGLSPSARIRLTVPQPKAAAVDPAEKYFG